MALLSNLLFKLPNYIYLYVYSSHCFRMILTSLLLNRYCNFWLSVSMFRCCPKFLFMILDKFYSSDSSEISRNLFNWTDSFWSKFFSLKIDTCPLLLVSYFRYWWAAKKSRDHLFKICSCSVWKPHFLKSKVEYFCSLSILLRSFILSIVHWQGNLMPSKCNFLSSNVLLNGYNIPFTSF